MPRKKKNILLEILSAIFVVFFVFLIISIFYHPEFNNYTSNTNYVNDKNNVDKNTNIILPESDILSDSNFVDTNLLIKALFCPEDNCMQILEDYFNKSNKIYCAVYEIDLPWVYKKINDKTNKNVVGIIEDDEQYDSVFNDANLELKSTLLSLKQENILRTDVKPQDYMHNKFCVFDSNVIWVGSLNFIKNDELYNNNNVLIIENSNIYNLFETEFWEMYNGTFNGGTKNPIQTNYPKLYFCPEDNCELHYLETLNLAERNVWCMFFDLTLDSIGNKLIDLKEDEKDVKVIFETRQAGSQYSEYTRLLEKNVSVIKDLNPKTMHNKFCIIDNNYLITGSMNPSKHSQTANDESIIIIDNKDIINKYIDYFRKYWSLWS